MTPDVSAAVGGGAEAGPQGNAAQPTPQSFDVLADLTGMSNVTRIREATMRRRFAQVEASCAQRASPLAPHDREREPAAAHKPACNPCNQPVPPAAQQAGDTPRDSTQVAQLTAALAAANQALSSAKAEAARAQASLATALQANMASLEAALALKREAMERVDRVVAQAEEKLGLQAVLARERERMLLLEAGRLRQVAAQWEARARSLEARMASVAAASGPASPVGSGPSPVAQAQVGSGLLRMLRQPSAAPQAAGDGAFVGVQEQEQADQQQPQQQEQQQRGAPGLVGVGSPSDIIRLGRPDSTGGAQAGSAVSPPPAPPQAAQYAYVAQAGSAQVHGGSGPAARQSAGQHFGLPSDCSPLDMLAEIAAALLPAHAVRMAPAGAATAPKRGRGRPPKAKGPVLEGPAAAASAAVAAAVAAGLIAEAAGRDGGAAAAARAAAAAGGSGQQLQQRLKRQRLHDDEMHVTARLVATARTAGPQPRRSPECAPRLPAVATAAAAAVSPAAAAAAAAAAAVPGGQGQAALQGAGIHAARGPGEYGCGVKASQEPTYVAISNSGIKEAGSSGPVAAGDAGQPQAAAGTPAGCTAARQAPCPEQVGSATSDGGRSRSCSGGGNSTDTTPFSPSQIMAEVSSAEAARKGARLETAAACVAAAAVAAAPKGEATSDDQGVEESAGVAPGATGRPCCGAAACGHMSAACSSRGTGAAAAGATARVVPLRPACCAAAHAPAAPAAAPAAAPRKAHMSLASAEAVMRQLYLDVLAAARAVPQAAAAFETRAALEQLPEYGRCVAAQDMMFFARIDARIGGRKAGFSRSNPLCYASPDALRADFARIMDNCHAYHSRAGGGSAGKATRALLELAVAVLEAADRELEAVRSSSELAEALAAVEAMEHKLECRDCGKWRRVRGYCRFVGMRGEFSCSKLPGRSCGEPCDVCEAAGGCECDD
ncbi:hypothetical protein HXX76_002792 [Chlamydomonas incerta]|uniref:Uncharacterized protein n=1 Tax=Chlamydomonas incerta TaxID=51695 RepID=A0A835W992_CHLIN|nr:hypothetical protein HXX76_002792 [Chlamydomonas incerta]|eukprot:KAG2442709.1 hypothetical protein HXX76_002792 [Chlamydomonas incerta]